MQVEGRQRRLMSSLFERGISEMTESKYKSYGELPWFLNADLVAKVLGGGAEQWVRADARIWLSGAEGGEPHGGAQGEVRPMGGGTYNGRW